jgi:hypothetical protein
VSRGASSGSNGSAAQAGARQRGGGQPYGQAVPRSSMPARTYFYYPYNNGDYGYLSPWLYYSPWAYGAFGFGYWGFDPYWWDGFGYYRSPYYYGWSNPYGYGYGGYGYDGYYGSPAGGGYVRGEYGSIKLKVKPREAEVYVDGYYMGQVDDFDGVFQRLDLEAGAHRIEIRASGYQPLTFEVRVAPGRAITYNGELRPGEVRIK